MGVSAELFPGWVVHRNNCLNQVSQPAMKSQAGRPGHVVTCLQSSHRGSDGTDENCRAHRQHAGPLVTVPASKRLGYNAEPDTHSGEPRQLLPSHVYKCAGTRTKGQVALATSTTEACTICHGNTQGAVHAAEAKGSENLATTKLQSHQSVLVVGVRSRYNF